MSEKIAETIGEKAEMIIDAKKFSVLSRPFGWVNVEVGEIRVFVKDLPKFKVSVYDSGTVYLEYDND